MALVSLHPAGQADDPSRRPRRGQNELHSGGHCSAGARRAAAGVRTGSGADERDLPDRRGRSGGYIKPRLESAGADCTRVLVIDEGKRELTLCDARLEEAIRRTGAKLIVLDPLQAYLGSDVDMHRANEVRPVLKRLSLMAERTQCAVILIGHMNKAQGLKSGYRGLGSIDFRASARSVLIVGRLKSDDTLRIVAQDKNSLAPEGAAIAFELHPEHGFQWKGFCDATVDNILNGTGQVQTKTMQMEDELRRFLTQPRPAEEVLALAKQLGISERTLKIAKRNLGILSERRADQWLWRLPEQEGKGVTP